jgi:hypothetical protein
MTVQNHAGKHIDPQDRSHLLSNAVLVLLGLLFVGALVAYFVMARG